MSSQKSVLEDAKPQPPAYLHDSIKPADLVCREEREEFGVWAVGAGSTSFRPSHFVAGKFRRCTFRPQHISSLHISSPVIYFKQIFYIVRGLCVHWDVLSAVLSVATLWCGDWLGDMQVIDSDGTFWNFS